ncbi:hypothetical protein B7P43_G04708 [Cryptotermes secundus]|uniref:Uncharacterized protein n=1 Tax=Cryptotermes secundus TaxID=105785 RepID=A0A2J7RG01_9NEOP|nr:hypothetical protein B7P43_G04708 [Cryptotermes secundus]
MNGFRNSRLWHPDVNVFIYADFALSDVPSHEINAAEEVFKVMKVPFIREIINKLKT